MRGVLIWLAILAVVTLVAFAVLRDPDGDDGPSAAAGPTATSVFARCNGNPDCIEHVVEQLEQPDAEKPEQSEPCDPIPQGCA